MAGFTTRRAVAAALAALAAAGACGACGASRSKVHRAQSSAYDAEFAVVFNEVVAVVAKLYPHFDENPSSGVIRTAWHQVAVTEGQTVDDPQQTNTVPERGNPFALTNATKLYFIRFRVYVLGGRPWRVRVEGEARVFERGNAVAQSLRGAETPHWVKGRTEALQVAIYDRLSKYAVPMTDNVRSDRGQARKPDGQERAFGDIPPAAARRVGEVLDAAVAADFTRLRGLMADDFTWSLGGEPSADQAIVMFQADPTRVTALIQALQAGCRASADATRVTCPTEVDPDDPEPRHKGYRAAFALVGGEWKLVLFVAGDP